MASHENQNLSTQTSYLQPAPTPEWSTEPISLKEFSIKRHVPGFARVVKGTYMTLGANKFSFQKQHHEMFIHSVKVGVKVLAHCLRRVETTSIMRRGSHNVFAKTRLLTVDQRLAIPISYQGWFELLSEDGKSARPITSVIELSKVKPEKCLVRENMKAYLIGEDGRLTFDKSRILLAGEQILLNGELSIPTSSVGNKKVKLLRCIDSTGDIIFISFDQVGTFTPIAGEDDFVGVFNIRDVVRRFRLPLTVKLVQGVRPKVDPTRFTGLIRLDWVYTDETVFVCPIEKNHVRLLPVPSDTNLQLVSAVNEQEIKSTELYRAMITKCNRMIMNYHNTLHLIVQIPEVVISKGKHHSSNVFSIPFQSEVMGHSSARARSRELRLMDETDDLYAYVRDGGAPPPQSKFTYDSDEDSYWEEPAYEPIDDFRARLQALEAGERVNYHSKYQPQDPRQLFGVDRDKRKSDIPNGIMNVSFNLLSPTDESNTLVPPLPPRPLATISNVSPVSSVTTTFHNISSDDNDKTSTNKIVAQTHTGQYSNNVVKLTPVYNLGLLSSQSAIDLSPNQENLHSETMQRSKTFQLSKSSDKAVVRKTEQPLTLKLPGSKDSTSNSGSSGNGNNLTRDFKDSDISSLTKADSSGSSGRRTYNVRKKMQIMYL